MKYLYSNFKILLFASLIWAIGCQPNTTPEPESKPRVVVAIDATFIPMSFMNAENQLDGFEVDLIKEVTQEAGLEYKLVNVEWGGLFGGLICAPTVAFCFSRSFNDPISIISFRTNTAAPL